MRRIVNRCLNLNKAGFSLIEMILAMAILAITLGAMMVILGGALNIVKKSREVNIATNLARKQIEFLKNLNFPPTANVRSDAEFNVDRENANGGDTSLTDDQRSLYVRDTWRNNASDTDDPDIVSNDTKFDIEVIVQSAGRDREDLAGTFSDVLKEVTVNVYRDRTPSDDTDDPGDLLVTLRTYFARNGI